jgi:hypothetical protein
MSLEIEIDGKKHKVFGIYSREREANSRINLDNAHAEFGIRKKYVGKSADTTYSDKEGCAYVIYYK